MKYLLNLIIVCLSFSSYSQDKPAYQIFRHDGKKVKYKKLLKASVHQEIILFGELHNNAIAHWLQLELTRDLSQSRELVLGAEMFEADNQNEVNAYLSEQIDAKALDSNARLWPNYKTDYAPLLDFSKVNGLPFIATNIPRRFANQVYKQGFEVLDSLSDREKSWVAPLPIAFEPDLPRYQEILKMMGDHGSPQLVMAQAIKDATMAHFIIQNYKDNRLFIHFNGAFHSDFYEGILWYLKLSQPNKAYLTISTVSQSQLKHLEKEHIGRADFIIVVDEDMTTTY